MLQGMTAHYLVHSTYPLKKGETTLIHAAAGGVGQLLVQMAKQIGARVIATAGTEEKAKLAREAGADEAIVYTQQDFEAETKRLTEGKGVHVIYDGVGKSDVRQRPESAAAAGIPGVVWGVERGGAAGGSRLC